MSAMGDLRELETRIQKHIDQSMIGYDLVFIMKLIADKLDSYEKRIEELESLLDARLKAVIK